jgi:two-component system NtrC family sensor kinase
MTFFEKLRPKFWDYQDVSSDTYRGQFNFRRIWLITVLLTAGVTLFPLIFVTTMDYRVTHQSIKSEVMLRTARLVSNTRRAVTFFLDERKLALDFVIHDNTYGELLRPERLQAILKNLKASYGGFSDLGLIDAGGFQQTYVGPYKLEGKNYADQDWFKKVVNRGIYISDVFLGYRNVPHMVVAVRKDMADGRFFLLRATLDLKMFNDLLAGLEISGRGEAFLMNRQGVLQTPTKEYGAVLQPSSIPVPAFDEHSRLREVEIPNIGELLVGYAYIEETPFILMVVVNKEQALMPWRYTRSQILGIALGSVLFIFIFILGMVTFLINNLFEADQRRLMALHSLEYSNKMATIGRLAAGVAHEINNPLAVINEKAGLIKDMFTINPKYEQDEKLVRQVDSIQKSVDRAAAVTHRLLGFARHVELKIQPIDLDNLIHEVLGFLGKEAERLSISVTVASSEDLPVIQSDQGKLQQIFLNIINNAFEAMKDGGRLDINAEPLDHEHVAVKITDNGCGISPNDLKRVFDPFFSTKTSRGGTGLGLSITYGLAKEIGGTITVESELGQGTTFTVTLPLDMKEMVQHARPAG